MTTTTLTPDGVDGTHGTVTVFGGGTSHAAIADVTDAKYVRYQIRQSYTLSNFTIPAGAVTKSYQLIIRARTPSTNAGIGLQLWPGYPSQILRRPIGTAFATFAGTVRPYTFAQADLNNVEFNVFNYYYSYDPAEYVEVSRAYLELTYVAKPVTVVNAVSPDPYTASTMVPVSWVNTLDADGGGQTTFRVRVFTDAQYGAGDFDPATSEATFDSGTVLSSSTSTSVGPLLTGDTYRAYVRVHQTVNGEQHRSDYAFDQFELDVSTADVSTVTATPANASGRIAVSVAHDGTSEDWSLVEVQRSFDSGVTWAYVRSAARVNATGDADTFTVQDYETANGQSVIYQARATWFSSDLPITGAWVQSSSTSWSSASAWLKSPNNSTKNLIIDVEEPFVTRSFNVRAGQFDVINRAAPIVISDVLSTPASTLVVVTREAGEYESLISLIRDMVLLYHPTDCEGGTTARYLSVLSVSETPQQVRNKVSRVWSVGYVEVAPPADPNAST